MVYSPVAAVTADFAIPVDTDMTVTLAPGTTAPERTVTVPTIAVSTVCARRPAGATAITSARNAETGVRMGTSSVREAVGTKLVTRTASRDERANTRWT